MLIENLERRFLFAIPSAWSETINNKFLPTIPGMSWVYKGESDGVPTKDRVVVQLYAMQIDGVSCTVVLDRLYTSGKLSERTHDYFAQDVFGNVWYFGEDTAELNAKGKVVSTEGSFLAGVNGASAGIIMEANPIAGDSYHQEFAPGVAEDAAKNLALHQQIKTPFGTFNDCLETSEFSPLEPGVVEHKYYAPGIGFIFSVTVKGGNESLRLIQFLP
jgi:hypothetical protein